MSLRGNNDFVNTDASDESLQTNFCAPERSWLQHGNNMSRTLTNRQEINTVTLSRITDKGRSESKLEKQKSVYISGKKRKVHDGEEDKVKEV